MEMQVFNSKKKESLINSNFFLLTSNLVFANFFNQSSF